MSNEMSMGELETEICTELPTRNLLRRRRHRRHHGGTSASAAFGSAANANSTKQVNFNPQIVINNGKVEHGGIHVTSHNSNHTTTDQNAVPVNFGN
jgi:hypothetical protein